MAKTTQPDLHFLVICLVCERTFRLTWNTVKVMSYEECEESVTVKCPHCGCEEDAI